MDEFLVPGASYRRLLADWEKYGSLYVAYDFDQTVAPFHDPHAKYGLVRQLIRDAKSIGCTVVCWTANPDHEYVEQFLKKNDIPCDGINTDGIYLGYTSKKPFFSVLLCDRAGLVTAYHDLRTLVDYIKRKT
jgi:hypothetical protein